MRYAIVALLLAMAPQGAMAQSGPPPLTIAGCLKWVDLGSDGKLCADLDPNFVDPTINAQCLEARGKTLRAARNIEAFNVAKAAALANPIGVVATLIAGAQHRRDIIASFACK